MDEGEIQGLLYNDQGLFATKSFITYTTHHIILQLFPRREASVPHCRRHCKEAYLSPISKNLKQLGMVAGCLDYTVGREAMGFGEKDGDLGWGVIADGDKFVSAVGVYFI